MGHPEDRSAAEHRTALARVLHSMITDGTVIDEVVAAARTSPEVAGLPVAENRRHVRVLLAAGLVSFERPETDPPQEDPDAALLGAERAVQGVPLTGLLRGVQAGRRRALEIGVARGRAAGVPDAVLLDAMLYFDRHASATERHVINGYRTAELELARTARDARTQVLRRLLHGGPAAAPTAEELRDAGLRPGARYHCLLSDVADPVRARALERRLTLPAGHAAVGSGERPGAGGRRQRVRAHPPDESATEAGDEGTGVFGLVDGRLAGLAPCSPVGLAADGPLLVISPAVPLAKVPTVHVLCGDALRAAAAYGLRGPHHLTDLAGQTALAAQPVLAELLCTSLLGALDPANGFHRELAMTALVYLDHDRRLDLTAAALHIHPNTVRYRLARLAKTTGDALEAPSSVPDTLRWWWALRTWLDL